MTDKSAKGVGFTQATFRSVNEGIKRAGDNGPAAFVCECAGLGCKRAHRACAGSPRCAGCARRRPCRLVPRGEDTGCTGSPGSLTAPSSRRAGRHRATSHLRGGG